MGYPIQNNYSILRALAYAGNRPSFRQERNIEIDREEYTRIREALRQFNLFAFVIHDPLKHQDFHTYIGNIFEKLDHTTGHNLLFFALVNPPQRWLDKATLREYYKELSKFYSQQGDFLDKPIITENKEETAFAIASSLNIPFEMLPVIVVTNDFKSKDFRWFRTSTYCIEKQLNELGYLAYDCPEIKYNWQLVEQIFSENEEKYDLGKGSEEDKTIGSLAKTLSDLLSFIVIAHGNNDNQLNNAITQARLSMQSLQATLKRFKKMNVSGRYNTSEIYDQLNVNIVNALSMLNSNSRRLEYHFDLDLEILERESQIMLKTATKVLSLFENNDWNLERILGRQNAEYDYTPIGICLSKVFEKEMNLSFVHWIRKQKGITLPHYFNLYEPGKDAGYKPDNIRPDARLIDFNKGRNGKWIPPGTGEAQLCFSSFKIKPDFPTNFTYSGDNTLNPFLTKWAKIRDIRNDCAHTEIINKATIGSLIRLIKEINSLGIFNIAHQMKEDFRA